MFNNKWELISRSTRKTLFDFSNVFQKSGYDCYLVGGSCRDLLLGVKPKDFDFATNCPIPKTCRLFKRVIETGVSHGTLTILYKGHTFEITRFRKDIKTDGRRAVVEFSDSIVEDQKRRDLRINAIAYDVVNGVLVDSQNGIQDFEEKMIRFVGNATQRINEDHLRALRYVRMIAVLKKFDFNYDPVEMEQVKDAFNGEILSLERVYAEFNKIFKIKNKDLVFLANSLNELSVFQQYLPHSVTNEGFFTRIFKSNSLFPFFLEYQKVHGNKKTALDLKISKKQRAIIGLLQKYRSIDPTQVIAIKQLMRETEEQDLETVGKIFFEQFGVDIRKQIAGIRQRGVPYRVAHLELKGKDILAMGIRGQKIGEVQQYLLKAVWKNPKINQKQPLQNLVESYLKL